MDAFQQAATARQVYRLRTWKRTLLIICSFLPLMCALLLTLSAIPNGSAPFGVIAALNAALGVFLVTLALRSRVVIDGTRISVRQVFREYSVDLSEIEGYRILRSHLGSDTRFYLKEGRGAINMPNSFATDDNFRVWLQQVTDLDRRDRDAKLEEISQQPGLGDTPQERLAALSGAKKSNFLALMVAVAAAITFSYGNIAIRISAALVLAGMPVALAVLFHRSPVLYTILWRRSEPRAVIAFPLIATGGGMFVIGCSISVNNGISFASSQMWGVLIGLFVLLFTAAFFRMALSSSDRLFAFFIVIFFGLFHSIGLTLTADTLADNSKGTMYMVPITGKHIETGDPPRNILELAPWGPDITGDTLTVSSAKYAQLNPGDHVCLALHLGRLHAPWYAPVKCPNGSPNDTTP